MKRCLGFFLVVLAAFSPLIANATPAQPAWRMIPPFSTETASITVAGSVKISAEIADTNELRARGLGNRDGLRNGWGMLFIDSSARVQSFWMKGMRFCLDIIWIQDGRITGAAQDVCPQAGALDADLKVYSSGTPVQDVLEMPANWLRENGLEAGSAVEIALPPSV